MPILRNEINKIFRIINEIEENPNIIVRKFTSSNSYSPFDDDGDQAPSYTDTTVPCMFSEKHEHVKGQDTVTTMKVLTIYIKEEDIGKLDMNDKFIFPETDGNIYIPKEIKNIFGLWVIVIHKASI